MSRLRASPCFSIPRSAAATVALGAPILFKASMVATDRPAIIIPHPCRKYGLTHPDQQASGLSAGCAVHRILAVPVSARRPLSRSASARVWVLKFSMSFSASNSDRTSPDPCEPWDPFQSRPQGRRSTHCGQLISRPRGAARGRPKCRATLKAGVREYSCGHLQEGVLAAARPAGRRSFLINSDPHLGTRRACAECKGVTP
jgi:hypothetical protein